LVTGWGGLVRTDVEGDLIFLREDTGSIANGAFASIPEIGGSEYSVPAGKTLYLFKFNTFAGNNDWQFGFADDATGTNEVVIFGANGEFILSTSIAVQFDFIAAIPAEKFPVLHNVTGGSAVCVFGAVGIEV